MAIRNSRDGYHFNSKHWQLYKKQIPPLEESLFHCAVGMILGDATLSKTHIHAHIKFEQGHKQKDFLDHLFQLFREYSFMEAPGSRLSLAGERAGEVKSYWFKTFSQSTFTLLYHSFYREKRKFVDRHFLENALSPRGLAYWVMSDGSLQKGGRECVLHSQGFSREENCILSSVINEKFLLNSRVIPHKKVYSVILIPGNRAPVLRQLLLPHLIPSMMYKLPQSRPGDHGGSERHSLN